jgi:hypothetical protein
MHCTGIYHCGFMPRMKLIPDLIFYRNHYARLQLRQQIG